ncbi:MAG: ATP synthase F1 subunit gamma [Candidatus Latescibacterota bacterium]
MATLRQLRTRIASVRNIQRVTNAMQLVAAARVRRAQQAILAARPYAMQLEHILQQLSLSVDPEQHPLMRPRPVKRLALVVVTSDRGLCGGFNSAICRFAQTQIRQHEGQGVELIAIGRKGRDFFRHRGVVPAREHVGLFRRLEFGQAATIAHELIGHYTAGSVDQVLLVFSEFKSLGQQTPVVHQLLPIQPEEGEVDPAHDYLFEPDPEQLLSTLVPRHVNYQVWRALLESNAGEQAARMTAMDNAARNAGDLIGDLTRQMNKERQSAITLELMDIVGGANAVSQG